MRLWVVSVKDKVGSTSLTNSRLLESVSLLAMLVELDDSERTFPHSYKTSDGQAHTS